MNLRNLFATLLLLLLSTTSLTALSTISTFDGNSNTQIVNLTTNVTDFNGTILLYKYINLTGASMNFSANISDNLVSNPFFEEPNNNVWVFGNSSNPSIGSAKYSINSTQPISGTYSGRISFENWGVTANIWANITQNITIGTSRTFNVTYNFTSDSVGFGIRNVITLRFTNGSFLNTLYDSGVIAPSSLQETKSFNLTQFLGVHDNLTAVAIDIWIANSAAVPINGTFTVDNVYIYDLPLNSYATINKSAGYLWNTSGILTPQNGSLQVNLTTFNSTLQTYLNQCTADSNGQCSVPIIINSSRPGKFNLTSLQINYTTNVGLYTRARDQSNQALINANLTISNGTSQFTTSLNASNSTTFFSWDILPTNAQTLTYSSAGYQSATYSLTGNSQLENNLTAQLLPTNTSTSTTVTFHVRNGAQAPIVGAQINLFRSISGTYTLVTTLTTVGTGDASAVLDSTLTYLINVSATGYTNQSTTFAATSTDLTIVLGSTNAAPIPFPLTDVNYTLLPYNVINGNNIFYFSLNSTYPLIATQRIALRYASNNTIILQNVSTTSQNGTNLSLEYIVNSNWTHSMVLEGYFNRTDNQQFADFRLYFNNSYPINVTNSSISSIATDLTTEGTKPSFLLSGILALVLTVIWAAALVRLGASPVITGICSLIFLYLLSLLGLVPGQVMFILTLSVLGIVYFTYKG